MAQGYYLYGVVAASAKKGWGATGVGKQEVTARRFREVAAAISPWTAEVVAATPENCLAHERALRTVMNTETVLPFEFGTVAPDLEAVDMLLRNHYLRFRRTLAELTGTVEVNVTAMWHDMQPIFEEVVKEHPMIAGYKREILSRPHEQTYRDRVKIGQIVAEALETKRRLEGEKLYRVLKKSAVRACQDCMGKPPGDNVIFRGAFLVQRGAYPDFERNLLELGRRSDRLDVQYTDPLPPYHFVDLKIRV